MNSHTWAITAFVSVLVMSSLCAVSAQPTSGDPSMVNGALKMTPYVNGTLDGGRGIPASTCPGTETAGAYATAVTLQTDAAGILTLINFTCSNGAFASQQSGNAMALSGGVQNVTKFQTGAGQGGFVSSTAYVYNNIIGGISFKTANGSQVEAGVTNSSATPVAFNFTGSVVGLDTTFAPAVGSYAAGIYWSQIALEYR